MHPDANTLRSGLVLVCEECLVYLMIESDLFASVS